MINQIKAMAAAAGAREIAIPLCVYVRVRVCECGGGAAGAGRVILENHLSAFLPTLLISGPRNYRGPSHTFPLAFATIWSA